MGGTVSLYDILKARKTGLSPDLYTKLRAQREMPERVITAEPPIYFKSDGTPLSEYQINGDTVQNGTPTPDSPVEVLGVGDRTGNFCNESTIQNGYYGIISGSISAFTSDDRYRAFRMSIKAGTYTIKIQADEGIKLLRIATANEYYDVSKDDTAYTFVISANTMVYVSWRNLQTTNSFTNMKVMLNSGSTALPYEPYSYKIPITLNSITQNVYLDEPLYSGDYIKRNADGTGVLHQDGTDTPITLPQLSTVKGNNELNISTTATPEVTLKGKIKQLPDSDMNALLSVMEEM